jgi:predicted RNA binding protein YcfA (HicA-like mRNA interferase family)
LSLPVVGWKQVLKALKKRGFYATRQSGSHIIVENGEGLWTAIPRKEELGKGLVLQIIADCDLTKSEFLDLL